VCHAFGIEDNCGDEAHCRRLKAGVTINRTVNRPMNYYRWLELIFCSPSDSAYAINIPCERALQKRRESVCSSVGKRKTEIERPVQQRR